MSYIPDRDRSINLAASISPSALLETKMSYNKSKFKNILSIRNQEMSEISLPRSTETSKFIFPDSDRDTGKSAAGENTNSRTPDLSMENNKDIDFDLEKK